MIGKSFTEDLDCSNFFDNIDDALMDFPGGFGLDDDSDSFPAIWTTHLDTWPIASDPLFSSDTNSNSSLELYVPFEDIVKLDKPPSFVEESLVENKNDQNSFSTKTDSSSSLTQSRSSSPVSVLQSNSTSSQTTKITSLGRPRTKRPRPPVQDRDSSLIIRIPKQYLSDHNNKKAKVASDLEVNGNNIDSCSQKQNPVRKCMHCEVTKTPQWRLGPMGPKTLCNACGVRYKSGRLFPEYRPAASPTFIPDLHSNSHKKVAEMRSKRCNNGGSYTTTEENDVQEMIPNNVD